MRVVLVFCLAIAGCQRPMTPEPEEMRTADPPPAPAPVPPKTEAVPVGMLIVVPPAKPLSKAEAERVVIPISPSVIGPTLAKEAIMKVIYMHKGKIRRCYENGLRRNESLAGKVAMKWVIKATGSVGAVTVESSTLGNEGVEKCVAKEIKRWRFPAPAGGGIVEVRYPFTFRRGIDADFRSPISDRG